MRKILYMALCLALASACVQEDKIEAPIGMEYDYVLPQGNASQAANDRIKAIYDTYGSFILYEFTQKDFEWIPAAGASSGLLPTADKPDPANVEIMIDLLDRAWLRFFPTDFLKGKGLPFRVFLVDTIKQPRLPASAYSPMQRNPLYSSYRVAGMSLAFAEVNGTLQSMDAAALAVRKNKIQAIVWAYYLSKGIIDVSDIPDEFMEGTSYATTLGYVVNEPLYYSRGFFPKRELSSGGSVIMVNAPVEFNITQLAWATSVANMTKLNDVTAYIEQAVQRTTAELQPIFDDYPLVKYKYDIVVDFIKTKYGVDLKAIANATL